MARTKMESLNEQIRKAEEDVIRIGDRYNAACDKLKELRAKKAAIEQLSQGMCHLILSAVIQMPHSLFLPSGFIRRTHGR